MKKNETKNKQEDKANKDNHNNIAHKVKPEQFEEERSMNIRMKPQPLREVKGKTNKR